MDTIKIILLIVAGLITSPIWIMMLLMIIKSILYILKIPIVTLLLIHRYNKMSEEEFIKDFNDYHE
jgi:hypothetical protein